MARRFPAAVLDLLPERSGEASLFHVLRDGAAADPDRFQALLGSMGLNDQDCFYAAFCVGIRPDYVKTFKAEDYSEFTLTNLCVYRDLVRTLRDTGRGFEAFRTSHCVCVVGVFPNKDRDCYAERHILPLVLELERRWEVPLLAGLGLPADTPERIPGACNGAEYAYHLFYFIPQSMIDLRLHRDAPGYAIDAYQAAEERAFRAILMQDPAAIDRIIEVIDILARFHYGNRGAVKMHTMEYTGTVASRLKRYRLLERDFFEMQNQLQAKVLSSATLEELKQVIRAHFQVLLPQVFENDRPKGKLVVEQVKDYIREHYMEDLSIRQLAGVAYVSPDYFSHMFKNETGKNYKTFLTEIRMKHAMELLRDTELHIGEISEKVGYKNPRSFVDAFKQSYDMSPMDYRRKHRKK